MFQNKITFDKFVRGLLFCLIVATVIFLLRLLSGVLLPFFVAWIIAYLIYPLVHFLQHRCRLRSRVLAILCAILLIAALITAAGLLIVPPMLTEFARLKEILLHILIPGESAAIPETINRFINEHLDKEWVSQSLLSGDNVMTAVEATLPRLWSVVSGSIALLFELFASFIILLYLVFILIDYEKLASGWLRLLPSRSRDVVSRVVTDVKVAMNRYFRGQALIASCVGVLFAVGFLIIDFPLAVAFGLFIGLLNMVPYLQLIALIPTVLLALLKAADTGGNFWWILVSALMVFGVVQMLQDWVITPKVMGKVTGLNPAIILLSLSIWGCLLGVVGLIIGLPLTTLLLSYYQKYVAQPTAKQQKTGEE